MHLAGYQNVVIAERLGFSEGRISQVINDPRAKKAIIKFRDRMSKVYRNDIETRLVALSARALDRIEETVDEDFKPGTSAKKHQDDVGFKLLEMAGYGKKKDDGESGGIRLTKETESRLVKALEKSAEATQILEMEEGEYEIEEAE